MRIHDCFIGAAPRASSAVALLSVLTVCLTGCATMPAQRRAGVLDFLYPKGSEAAPPGDVHLELPLRVGVAFVPETESGMAGPLDATERQRLLQRVAKTFADTEGVERIEIIPPGYLTPGGGFANVDQLRGLFGIDLIALLSYEQRQVEDMTRASITYWSIVGAYVVPANLNDTHTFVDTSVFDVRSRALLFNAAGRSHLEGRTTAAEAAGEMRKKATKGFEAAIADMTGNLEQALAAFREQVKTGTVRGAGTPAITVSAAPGSAGGTGAGALGLLELGFGLALAGGALARRRTEARAIRRDDAA